MSVAHLSPFELDLDDRFSVVEATDSHLALTSTEPVMAVRCAVMDARPDGPNGEAAQLAVSSVVKHHVSSGATVLNVAAPAANAYAVLLDDARSVVRVFALAVERDDKVLLVQGRTPTADAAEADELMSGLITQFGEA